MRGHPSSLLLSPQSRSNLPSQSPNWNPKMSHQLNADAGGRTLFDLTFGGSLSLLPTWEDQPETFREIFRRKAIAVAMACGGDEAYAEHTTAPRTA